MEYAKSLQSSKPSGSDAIPLCKRDVLGVPVTVASLSDTLKMAEQAIHDRRPVRQVSINVAKYVAMRTDPELNQDVRSSDIVNIDGMGFLWAARALGLDFPERVAGIDLMEALIGLCAREGYRPYLLGATGDVLEKAIANMQMTHPGISFAGWHDGYFTAEQEPGVVEHIKQSRADCLFVAMPTPKKERFVQRHHQGLGVPFIMGVGGSLDVMSGLVKRAPKWIQLVGMEWLYRTAQEPLRLAPRYIRTNAAFFWIMAGSLVRKYVITR
jgi:N-acetylglucosaminyldiphosphoundecaprenol N-acetyl-beta-D-mannosaminyltransferase